jgi:peptidoglycan/LPS O-acetylase OafA/YrhL
MGRTGSPLVVALPVGLGYRGWLTLKKEGSVEVQLAPPPANAKPPVRGEKLLYLESIRGLGALSVVVYHGLEFFFPAVTDQDPAVMRVQPLAVRAVAYTPLRIIFAGPAAVSVFFVLSGFVLSYSFFIKERYTVLVSAAIRRYFRLSIPILGSTLLAYSLLALGLSYNQRVVSSLPASSVVGVSYDFTPSFLRAVGEGLSSVFARRPLELSYDRPLWTMKIEFAGSFLVYLFLALFGLRRWRPMAYGLTAGLLLFAREYIYLDFLAGIALCDFYTHVLTKTARSLPWSRSLAWTAFVLGIYFCSYSGALFPMYRWLGVGTPLCWNSVGAVLIILAAVLSPRVRAALSVPAISFLGKISFPLYLVHWPILCSLSCGVFFMLSVAHSLPKTTGGEIALAVGIIASLGISWVFYLLVDRPALSFGKQIVQSRLQAWTVRGDRRNDSLAALP